eukprot:16435204-Heterocapsa_arctica.AAC.2
MNVLEEHDGEMGVLEEHGDETNVLEEHVTNRQYVFCEVAKMIIDLPARRPLPNALQALRDKEEAAL